MSIGLGFCSDNSPDCSELYPTIFIIVILIALIIICGPWCIFAFRDKGAQDSINGTLGSIKTKTRNIIQSTPLRKYYVKKPKNSTTTTSYGENKVMITIDDNVFDA